METSSTTTTVTSPTDDDDENVNDELLMSNDEESIQHKQEHKAKTTIRLHHSPSKRISLKGDTYTLDNNTALSCGHNRKRRIGLEFTTGFTSKMNFKDSVGVDSFDGVDGKFSYKEV